MKSNFGKPDQPKTPTPLPNHGGIRKVGLLVIMLILVLYGMYEAGKPENWEWMGFAEPAQADGSQADKNPVDETPAPEQATGQSQDVQLFSGQNNQDADPTLDDWSSLDLTSISRENFWRQIFKRQKKKERLAFFEMIQALGRGETLSPADLPNFKNEFARIEKSRNAYHAKMLETMVSVSDRQPSQQKSYSELLFDLQQAWEYEIQPLFTAVAEDKTFTSENQQAAQWLARTFQTVALDEIKDGTADIRDVELPAWSQITRRLKSISRDELAGETLGEIDMSQLMGQTTFYRNKVVSLKGQLLRAQKIPLSHPLADTDHIYELWIAPLGKSVFPYCVYALELPNNFDDIGYESASISVPIELDGIVFKKRFYTASDGTGNECPLILTNLPLIHFSEESAQHPWAFDSRAIWLLAIIMLIAGVGIARAVFKSSQRRQRIPGLDQQQIDQSLDHLRDDPSVESIQDKLDRISE